MNRIASSFLGVLLAALLAFSLLPTSVADEGTRGDIILRVGVQEDMKSRNLLAINDMWSRSILYPVYTTVALSAPGTEELLPYLLKGVDSDDDGLFEQSEYGVFEKKAGSNTSVVTAYYDFNGVHFHDGVQATMDDLLFSYHLFALDPSESIYEAIQDKGNLEGSNYSITRWLWVYPVDDAWDESIPVGEDDMLTFALRFELQTRYTRFSEHVLAETRLLPRHLWEGTGRVCETSVGGSCVDWKEDIHTDFGFALDPDSGNGIPVSEPEAFQFTKAWSWLMEDDHVVGTGPFEFDEWKPGVTVALVKFEDFHTNVRDRNGVSILHPPYIDRIAFRIYKTSQAAVFSLEAGEIEVISWPVPPEFVPGILGDPKLELSVSLGQQFVYLGYDMRRSPIGYPDNDPSQGDDGLYLRRAIAHLIDRETIITTLLQDLGLPADQAVYPGDVKWYNWSVARYDYDLDTARQILDDHYTIGGFGLGWSGGWRVLPTIGTQQIEILCPQADYDPIRAQACNMMAGDMSRVGLNAYSRPPSIIDYFDYEMWIVEETRSPDLVEYYYATFRSVGGRNLAGFQNETFDRLVSEARGESDENRRISLVKQCSGILADTLPYDFLYFRTNAEAYRADRFVNWTLGVAGSIFREAFWSLVGVHPPWPKQFGLSLSSVSAMKSEGSTQVVVTARDLSRVGMPGVNVELCVDVLDPRTPPGNVILQDQRGLCVSGETDINGNLVVGYEAPLVDNGTLVALFTAFSVVTGLGEASAKSQMTVYSALADFLCIRIEMTSGDVLFAGDYIPMRIEVTDSQAHPVVGSAVTIASFPEGLIFSPSNEAVLSDGTAAIRIKAPIEILNEEDELVFAVIVAATAEGYGTFEAQKEITVLRSVSPPIDSDYAYAWRLVLVITLLVLIGIALVLSTLRRQSNRKKRSGPRKGRD